MKLKRIRIKSPAKINLFLAVTGRRENGYHNLSTVMQTISLYNEVKLQKAEKTEVVFSSGCFEGVSNAQKALNALSERVGKPLNCRIEIKERIPTMSGLGGSSSDAAAVLVGANKLFSLGLTEKELMETGLKIGADVPFLIRGGIALCEGVGEEITPIKPLPKCYILVARPKGGNKTPEIFARFREKGEFSKSPKEEFLKALEEGNLSSLCSSLRNDLSPFAGEESDNLRKIMIENGAETAVLTGSGSAVFGIFSNRRDRNRAYLSTKRIEGVKAFKVKAL